MINLFSKDVPSFLNLHSCEKNWLEFLLTPSNELRDSDEVIMGFLKNMAYSFSETSLSFAASLLEESSVWHTSVKLRTWFQAEWLPTAKVSKHIYFYGNECNLSVTQAEFSFIALVEPWPNGLVKVHGCCSRV